MGIFTLRPRLIHIIFFMSVAIFISVANATETKRIDLREHWGIEPVHLRITAGGYMVEFRYKIIDREKALVLSDREYFPRLQVMKSRARLSVPFFPTVGFVKSNRRFLKEGKNYTALFSNEGRHLLPGDKAFIQVRDQLSPVLTLQ